MDDGKTPLKSLAIPIAAGFLIGNAIYAVLQMLWHEIFELRRFIEWDWTMSLGNRVSLNCGGCLSVFVVAVLAIAAGFALIKLSQK